MGAGASATQHICEEKERGSPSKDTPARSFLMNGSPKALT
jgi:hypothetical protein